MSVKSERLVNLTVVLLDARVPQTFAQIKRKLRAYEQDDAESARRMFERDKDALRQLGVPIDTRDLGGLSDEQGYIIDREAYALPDIAFTAEEVAALSVALQVTGEESARLGLTKLVTRQPDPADHDRPSTHVALGGQAVADLSEAVVERRAVRFGYRRGDGQETQREVHPFGVASRRGRWYLVGEDRDRGEVRAFRLDRMTGPPKAAGDPGAYEIPEGFSAREHIEGPVEEPVDAVVAIHPDVAWEGIGRGGTWLETRDDGWQRQRFASVQPFRLQTWVLGLGEHAVVEEPASLREAVVRHLERVAEVGA